MCLAVPAKVLSIKDDVATVDYGGVRRQVQLALVEAAVGDYVLIHAGFAIEVMDERSAMKSLREIERLTKISRGQDGLLEEQPASRE
jgi:hydrogenase expression/formation protein HypC